MHVLRVCTTTWNKRCRVLEKPIQISVDIEEIVVNGLLFPLQEACNGERAFHFTLLHCVAHWQALLVRDGVAARPVLLLMLILLLHWQCGRWQRLIRAQQMGPIHWLHVRLLEKTHVLDIDLLWRRNEVKLVRLMMWMEMLLLWLWLMECVEIIARKVLLGMRVKGIAVR